MKEYNNKKEIVNNIINEAIKTLSLYPREFYSVILKNAEYHILKDIAYTLGDAVCDIRKGMKINILGRAYEVDNFLYVPLVMDVKEGDSIDGLENLVKKLGDALGKTFLLVLIDDKNILSDRNGHNVIDVGWVLANCK